MEKAKLNKESLEKHFPKVEIPRLNYDCDLSILEYKSPIQVRVEQAVKAFNLQVENEVYKVVQNYEINVDKDELLKALRCDRNQYELGYRAGYNKAYSIIMEFFAEIEKEIGYIGYLEELVLKLLKDKYKEVTNNDGE